MKLLNTVLEEDQTVNFYVDEIRGKKVVLASLNGQRVGALRLEPYKDSYAVDTVSVTPSLQGYGIGKKLYSVAFKYFGPFYSDLNITPDARRVWDSFIRKGQATEEDGRIKMIKESLRDWFKKEKWVRITTSGNIAGPCGTSKNKKNPDRCLPKAKAQSLTKAERAATAQKKKKAGAKGKTVVKNTKKAKVTKEDITNLVAGLIYEIKGGKELLMEKDDRCTRIAKRKYDTWPSAYASGAVVRCRRGEIWKKEK